MALKFGTSGIRGLEDEFTDEICISFTRAFVRHFQNKFPAQGARACVVGGDLRRSTPKILHAICLGLAAEGYEVLDAGIVPTPALATECMKRGLPGIMVTGSHIPADRNGIKFYFPCGEVLKEDEAPILKLQAELGVTRKSIPAGEDFVRRYTNYFAHGSLSGKTVVFYEHSTAARDLLPRILEELGAKVVRIGRSETFVPVDTEALESLEELKGYVLKHGAFALISADGDGDRPLLLDERGELVRGDQLGIISSAVLSAHTVCTPVSTTTALDRSGWFKDVRRTKIGSPFVIAAMEEAVRENPGKTVVGFEANGGFLLASDVVSTGHTLMKLPTRDSVLPVLLVLNAAAGRGKTVSELVAELPRRFTDSDLIREFPVTASARVLSRLVEGGKAFIDAKWSALPPAGVAALEKPKKHADKNGYPSTRPLDS